MITNPHKALRSIRRRTISHIRAITTPHMRDSGYVDHSEPSDRLQICTFKGANDGWRRLRGRALKKYYGFTRYGVIEDWYSGGMSTFTWSLIPVEDLMILLAHLKKYPPKWE